jgi:hypothetical protein
MSTEVPRERVIYECAAAVVVDAVERFCHTLDLVGDMVTANERTNSLALAEAAEKLHADTIHTRTEAGAWRAIIAEERAEVVEVGEC